MPNRSSKPQVTDPNRRAFLTIQKVIAASDPPAPNRPAKDPLAVELGRRGGLKGGKARAESLSARKRSAIAKRAARARWFKGRQPKKSS